MKRLFYPALVVLLLFGITAGASAQCVSLTTPDSAVTQNFDTLSNTAGSTTNNLTITGWFMTESGGGARDNEQYGVDTGASNTGDTYSYGAAAASERALGSVRSGSLAAVFGACFTNNTGITLTSVAVAYTGEEWRLGTAARTDRLDFAYSLNATDLVTGTWTDADVLDFVTPNTATTGAKDGNAAANRTALSSTISSLSVANGATFWIRWTDVDGSGSDDGLAVDDFSLTPSAVAPLPTLSVNDVSAAEGNSGTTNFTFTASLSTPAPAGGVTFDIATLDGTATTGDNDFTGQTLTSQVIPQGQSSFQFVVAVNGDSTSEFDETFFVNVTNVVGANVGDAQGIGTIQNDDAATTIDFEFASYIEDESQTMNVRVVRAGDVSGISTVEYTTEFSSTLGAVDSTGGASCAPDIDYIIQNGTLTFAADELEKNIEIPICSDLTTEANEGFPLVLFNPTNAALGANTPILALINNTASQFKNGDTLGFPASGDANGSEIFVSTPATSLSDLRVTLYDIEHLDAGDVDILLVGPQGQKFLLMADAGGTNGLEGIPTLTFSDAATQVVPQNAPIATGIYEPTTWEPGQSSFTAPAPVGPYIEPGSALGGPVTLNSVFAGTNPNGTWSLYVRDDLGSFQPFGLNGVIGGGWGLQFNVPTAAGVSVEGRVRSGKIGVANALVMISGGDLVTPRTVQTNQFGKYRFEGLTAGQTYIVTVSSRRYTFSNPTVVVNVDDNVTDLEFTANVR